MLENTMSPADFSALMGNGATGNSSWIWLLIILIFIGGFGGGWNNQGEFGKYATAASQDQILFGQRFGEIQTSINKVGDGISSLGYSQLQQMDANTASINGNVTNEGRALQMQIAECCCGNKEATAQVRYDMANFAAQINSNIDNKFASLEKAQLEQTIAAQQSQINQLSMAQQMAGVVKYPMASTYAMMNNPFCGCNTCCAN